MASNEPSDFCLLGLSLVLILGGILGNHQVLWLVGSGLWFAVAFL